MWEHSVISSDRGKRSKPDYYSYFLVLTADKISIRRSATKDYT